MLLQSLLGCHRNTLYKAQMLTVVSWTETRIYLVTIVHLMSNKSLV